MPVFQLEESSTLFPDPRWAESDGLLAVGGDLSTPRLLSAYQQGIFPWFGPEDPILWWSPDPRFILKPQDIQVSHSMKQVLRKGNFEVRWDTAFEQTIRSCKMAPRKEGNGTWITEDMVKAYVRLHKEGWAHSIETWMDNELVGGLYGVRMGKCFFGESMFSHKANASKIALIHLSEWCLAQDFYFIDCQVYTPHLESMGATFCSRQEFLFVLKENINGK